jgi:hypothetical protein
MFFELLLVMGSLTQTEPTYIRGMRVYTDLPTCIAWADHMVDWTKKNPERSAIVSTIVCREFRPGERLTPHHQTWPYSLIDKRGWMYKQTVIRRVTTSPGASRT